MAEETGATVLLAAGAPAAAEDEGVVGLSLTGFAGDEPLAPQLPTGGARLPPGPSSKDEPGLGYLTSVPSVVVQPLPILAWNISGREDDCRLDIGGLDGAYLFFLAPPSWT